MFKNYLKIAIRNLRRHKVFSFINIFGLAVGMACCILIILWIKYEFSYDRFHYNADRIYRFTLEIKRNNGYKAHFARCATSWIKYIPDEFPEVEKMVTLAPCRDITLIANEKKFSLQNAFYADSTFFNVFSIDLKEYNSNKVLAEPNTAVISESLAKKCFGNSNPVGQIITNTAFHDGKEWTKLNYMITAVFKDIPPNSHFHADLLISKTSQLKDDWKYVYLLLNKHSAPSDFLNKFHGFLKKHENEEEFVNNIIPHLQLITDIHLQSNKDRELENNNNMTVILIVSLIGSIVLMVSWINYLNLNIACTYSRLQSIHVFKIHGCPKSGFLFLFFIESCIIASISFIAAYLLIGISLPTISTLTGNLYNSNIPVLFTNSLLWILLMFVGTITVGTAPAFIFLFKPSSLVFLSNAKTIISKKKSSALFRKSLVIFQFSLTIALIISAVLINLQSKYIQDKQAGANLDSVTVVKLFNQNIISKYNLLKSELLQSPYIKEVTASSFDLYDLTLDAMGFETQGIKPENKDKILWVYPADDNILTFLNVPIIAGHNFFPQNENIKREDYILNEKAIKELGWTPEEAIGKPFKLKSNYTKNIIFGGNIVGVVKDFNVNTLHHEIKPFVFFQTRIWFWKLFIKIDNKNKQNAMQYISKTWDKIAFDYPLDYQYNEEIFFNAYKKEIIQSRLTNYSSILAILISCMGLFAISSILIAQRTKEIGIRKVNGASTWQILLMLNKDFAKWVFIANTIAWPVAYYFMNKWLQDFAYRIEISWWVFVLSGGIAFVIALLTVSYQAIKAATRNPVEALKYE